MTTIRAEISSGKDIPQRLRRTKKSFADKLESTIRREALNLVNYIKNNKLSDQVLRVRTGRLRRSITAKFSGSGLVFEATVGTNVEYARVHEYGFVGDVNVPAHDVKASRRMMTVAFGKPMANPRIVDVRAHVVAAHSMKMNMPERSFLRSSLEENMDRIQTNIKMALIVAIAEAKIERS